MKYIVIEIQKNQDGSVGNFVWSFDGVNEAEQKYHQVLSACAVSNLPCHSCVMLNEEGMYIKSECFKHGVE